MSGTTTIVASTLPVSVVCTGTTAPVGIPPYSTTIEGTRGLDAVNGVGITYNVDNTALGEWLGNQPEIALQVKAITQSDLDALASAEDEYGFELGLDQPGTSAVAGIFGFDPSGTTARENLAAATLRQSEAERSFTAMERQRKMLEYQSAAVAAERDAATAAAQEATKVYEEQQARIQQGASPAATAPTGATGATGPARATEA